MDKLQLLIAVSMALFALGLLGVIVRRNVLVMLMCMELMLNGVNLSLVAFAQQTASTAGAMGAMPLPPNISAHNSPANPQHLHPRKCQKHVLGNNR